MIKVTIKDIAKQAGVSPTTVSFAFNYPERLPDETVTAIRNIARELHYVPNPVARSMISGRSGTIGVILHHPLHSAMMNPFLLEFLLGMSEVCDSEDLSIMLLPPTREKFEQTINRSMVDGFITVLGVDKDSQEMAFLEQRGIPTVMTDTEPVEGFPTIQIDDEVGAYQGMKYVLESGHRDIAISSCASESPADNQGYERLFLSRFNGYKKALAEFGMDFKSESVHIFKSPDTIIGAEKVFPRIWGTTDHPTAIVATSDLIAFGVILAARNMNIRVPEDLSVLGFDDLPLSASFIPPLTTIHQPNYEKGKLATEMLIKGINGIDVPHVMLPTELKIRDSVLHL